MLQKKFFALILCVLLITLLKVFMFNKIFKCLFVISTLFLLQSCIRTKVLDVKSPCVSGKGGPCDVRVPVNTWLEQVKA